MHTQRDFRFIPVRAVKHVLMRAVKSRFKDKNYAGAAKAARMFEALQNSRNSAPPLMDWCARDGAPAAR